MPELITRRGYLLAAIQHSTGPWTTQRAEHALAGSPFSCHRNTARKDLRALAKRGELMATDENGRRTYIRTDQQRSAAA